jgi:8-oxo-dGTP diphosphatase
MTGVLPSFTAGGRPAFVVNVEVFLHRDGRWLLIRRGAKEAHAPGTLAGVGGKVEADVEGADVLERCARREVAEEIGVDLTGVRFAYVESALFVSDDGDPVVNVVFSAPLPDGAEPVAASADEVAGFVWLTTDEAAADANCPPWTRRAIRKVSPG